jgi:hypothetical protein
MMFLDCPAYLDPGGAHDAGFLPRSGVGSPCSQPGPVESAMIRCPAGHWFNGPIESLTLPSRDRRNRGTATFASSISRDNLRGGHDRLDGHKHCSTGAERLT